MRRRPFVLSFISFRFALRYLDFLHFSFRSYDFSFVYFLAAYVILDPSRFGGEVVVLFVLAFVSVGVLNLAEKKRKGKGTPMAIHKTRLGPFFIPRR